jgi:hypothetical protein
MVHTVPGSWACARAVTLAPGAPVAMKTSQRRDLPAAHCPGWPLRQPSGPDGEGQAGGQARYARGEPAR